MTFPLFRHIVPLPGQGAAHAAPGGQGDDHRAERQAEGGEGRGQQPEGPGQRDGEGPECDDTPRQEGHAV